MTKKKSILGMGRICLKSFILLCCMFMNENSFSLQWSKKIAPVEYNKKDNAIYFSFPFHQYTLESCEHGYLMWGHFSYSLRGKYYLKLMSITTKYQKCADRVSILMYNKRSGKHIEYFTSQSPSIGTFWIEGTDVRIEVDVTKFKVAPNEPICKLAYISIKWSLSDKSDRVKYFKIIGFWSTNILDQGNKIELNYTLDNDKLSTNTINNDYSELNTEISDNVKVTVGKTDTIIITGAEPGENIKIYTVSGLEVKSVVANDDVVNIKLEKNQIYIVKAGQARYKVAL